MKNLRHKFEFSYDVDRNLFLLFEFVTMFNAYFSLPKKYSKLLSKIEFELDSEIFKRPSTDTSVALVGEKLTITDVWEKENIKN